MAVRDDRSDVRQTTTGFRGPLMVQSLTSAKSKFLSLVLLGQGTDDGDWCHGASQRERRRLIFTMTPSNSPRIQPELSVANLRLLPDSI